MLISKLFPSVAGAIITLTAVSTLAQHADHPPRPESQTNHVETVHHHQESSLPHLDPALPEGMSLIEVLERADQSKPADWPDVIKDNTIYSTILLEQIEYRIQEEGKDHLGWETQGWIGYDFDKFWWKNEGEANFDGTDEGGTETDLLYSRLITPFWNLQVGVQYASMWEVGVYDDRWSGVIALQGLAPGMFEVDTSLYISDEADVTLAIEAEYDIWITQRLVLQPRAEIGFAMQDIPDRSLGAGMTDANLDLRLRYEVSREFAPYIGARYRFLTGETRQFAQDTGDDPEQLFLLLGVRLQF